MLERDQRTNRLLLLLSDHDYERLRSHLSVVDFDYRKSLYEASRPIEHVYFPINGVASLVITTSDGASAEVEHRARRAPRARASCPPRGRRS